MIVLDKRRAKRLSLLRFQSFAELFGNQNPVEVEIGSGRGNYLASRASQSPGINFLGVEWKTKLVHISGKRSERMCLRNIRFIDVDAREVVNTLQPGSVSVFHIYFPDPWFKKRHLSRRILTSNFLAELHTRLMPGALIEIATDDLDYFQNIKREVVLSGISWQESRESINQRIFNPSIKTLFECKYELLNKPLYYLELKK